VAPSIRKKRKKVTNSAEKRRPLCRRSSLADSGHGGALCLWSIPEAMPLVTFGSTLVNKGEHTSIDLQAKVSFFFI
jgi:hypothetical protein